MAHGDSHSSSKAVVASLNTLICDIYIHRKPQSLVSTQHREIETTVHEPYIHILSSDVLIEIFSILFDEQHRNYDDTVIPLQYLLSTVCQQWRALIINTPLLWNVIHVSSNSPFYPTLFFERSKPALIDVYFHSFLDWGQDGEHAGRISAAISANFSRVRSFMVHAWSCREIFEMFLILKDQDPINLTTLHIATSSGFPDHSHLDPFPIDTINVKHLDLTNFPFEGFSTLTSLTTLAVDRLKTDVQTFQALFGTCPSLSTLVIREFGSSDDHAGIVQPRIDAPSLQNLIINIGNNHSVDCRCFFPFLFAQNLEQVDIIYLWSLFTPHHKAILTHLKEFSKLHKLRIRSHSIWLQEDISFLSSLSDTTNLEIIGFPTAVPAHPTLLSILNLSNVRSITIDLNTHRKHSMNLQNFSDLIHDKPLPALKCPIFLRSDCPEELLSGHPLHAMLGDNFALLPASAEEGLLDEYVNSQDFHMDPLLWEEESDYGDDNISYEYGEYESDVEDQTQIYYDDEDFNEYEDSFGGRSGQVDEYHDERDEFDDPFDDNIGDD